jgi:virulence factor Mce-like protein
VRYRDLLPPLLGRLTAVVLVLALAVAGLRAGGEPERMQVTATFGRGGLNVQPGYEVRVRGLPVGKIKAIEVDRRDFSAEYVLELDPKARIAKDTRANLVPKTLFGDKYVQLDPAPPNAPVLEDGDEIERARTGPATEVQDVIDRVVPMLEAVDPERFGATIASLGEALGDSGQDLRRMMEGWTPALEEMEARSAEIGIVLDHVPGVGGTIAERSGDLATAARELGKVAGVIGDNEPALGKMLEENAELTSIAADLLKSEEDRLGRVIPDMVDVVAIIASQPGQLAKFARTLRFNIRGTAEIMKTGWIKTRVGSTVIINPGTMVDAPPPYGETDDSNGIGPDVYVHGLPNENITIPPEQQQQQSPSASPGLDVLLGVVGGPVK